MSVDSDGICFPEATAVKTWYGMSDTQWHIDAARHQNEEYLQISVDGIHTDLPSLSYLSLHGNVWCKYSKEV